MEALWDMLLGYSHVPYALQHGTQCKFRGYCPQKKLRLKFEMTQNGPKFSKVNSETSPIRILLILRLFGVVIWLV